MEWLYVYAFLIGVVTAVYLFFQYRFTYWSKCNVPHLPPSIPYGSLKNVGKTRHIVEMIQEIYVKFKSSFPIAGAYFTISPVAVILDLDLIRDILIKDFNHFHDRPFFYNERDDPLSAHLFAIEGEKWRRLRNKLTPTFSSAKMKFMYPTVVDVSTSFLNKVNEDMKIAGMVEMRELLACFSTDIIGTCAFGIECNSLNNPKAELRSVGRRVLTEFRHARFVQEILNQFPKFFAKCGVKMWHDDTSEFFIGVVKETIAYREKNKIRRNDFMDMLIEMKNNEDGDGEKLTIEEIAAQAFVFFLAGFETSSTTMSYSLYELALQPALQAKARDEIAMVLKKYNGQLTYDALHEMKYIRQIVSESLRMYPPVPILIRSVTKDYPIPNTDVILEKGKSVIIPIYSVQRDPDIYPNPEVFDPDRFTAEEERKRHAMSSLGFGQGPRNCIGMRFGQMQASIGLVTLLQNFEIKTCKETIIPWTYSIENPIVLAPEGGLYLRMEKI